MPPEEPTPLTESQIEHIVDLATQRTIEKMEGGSWIERQQHYDDHQFIAQRRDDELNEVTRRRYVDFLIEKDRKSKEDRRTVRRTIVGGVAVAGIIALFNDLTDILLQGASWLWKVLSGQ